MTTLNDTFSTERELTQDDKAYESRSESLSIPTPLSIALRIYHISMSENLSFNTTTPLTAPRILNLKIQKLQPCMPLFGVYQL